MNFHARCFELPHPGFQRWPPPLRRLTAHSVERCGPSVDLRGEKNRPHRGYVAGSDPQAASHAEGASSRWRRMLSPPAMAPDSDRTNPDRAAYHSETTTYPREALNARIRAAHANGELSSLAAYRDVALTCGIARTVICGSDGSTAMRNQCRAHQQPAAGVPDPCTRAGRCSGLPPVRGTARSAPRQNAVLVS